jgi:hypothetical protein
MTDGTNNNNNNGTATPHRQVLTRRQRSDSIPEDRVVQSSTTITTTTAMMIENSNTVDNSIEYLMRHSSPLSVLVSPRVVSPATERRNSNSSPSPLRMNRPRSNPRNRTPNRATEEGDDDHQPRRQRQQQQQQQVSSNNTNEGRRITIRPMAGAAVGTNMGGTRVRPTRTTTTKMSLSNHVFVMSSLNPIKNIRFCFYFIIIL